MKRKIIIIFLLFLLIILGIYIYFKLNKKVESIVIDINNVKCYNLKVSMAQNYKTLIYGTNTSKINVDYLIYPKSKKKVNWVINNNCAQIDEDNNITFSDNCHFKIYAEIDNVKSNELEFKIETSEA